MAPDVRPGHANPETTGPTTVTPEGGTLVRPGEASYRIRGRYTPAPRRQADRAPPSAATQEDHVHTRPDGRHGSGALRRDRHECPGAARGAGIPYRRRRLRDFGRRASDLHY